jgi:hypothetical protein
VQSCVKDLCVEKASSGTKEVSKVQQGCFASRETEAVEIDLAMSTALSKDLLADRQGPIQEEARFSKAAL